MLNNPKRLSRFPRQNASTCRTKVTIPNAPVDCALCGRKGAGTAAQNVACSELGVWPLDKSYNCPEEFAFSRAPHPDQCEFGGGLMPCRRRGFQRNAPQTPHFGVGPYFWKSEQDGGGVNRLCLFSQCLTGFPSCGVFLC